MLDVKDLSVRYGQIQALDHLSMHIRAGEIVSVIGANGAGKSTLLKSIAGLRLAMAGRITFEGKALVSKSFEIGRRGSARRQLGGLRLFDGIHGAADAG